MNEEFLFVPLFKVVKSCVSNIFALKTNLINASIPCMIYQKPQLIDFPKIGSSIDGYISIAEKDNLPFEVKRIYWTYFTPESVKRGGHAHLRLQQILVAVAGRIIVTTQMPGEEEQRFILEAASQGIFIPQYCWRTMQYTHNAVQMCIANMAYEESDYIRDYEEFKKLR